MKRIHAPYHLLCRNFSCAVFSIPLQSALPRSPSICEGGGNTADQFVQVIRHRRSEERHQAWLISRHMVVAAGDHITDIIAIETGDHDRQSSVSKCLFDA